MANHTTTSVPVNGFYAALVGEAVYIFTYYEWTIIWIVEFLENGFASEFCSGRQSLTSDMVEERFLKVINNPRKAYTKITKQELIDCHSTFKALIVERYALIHAQPCTDTDGAQNLNYQTNPFKPLPDMNWPYGEVERLISIFDKAACDARRILDKIYNTPGFSKVRLSLVKS
jgi:hypothetical protein